MQVFACVTDRLFLPLCRAAFAAPMNRTGSAGMAAAARQVLAEVLFHPSHMQGLYEAVRSLAASELGPAVGNKSADAAVTDSAPAEDGSHARMCASGAAASYHVQLLTAVQAALTACMNVAEASTGVPAALLPFLQRAFCQAVHRMRQTWATGEELLFQAHSPKGP